MAALNLFCFAFHIVSPLGILLYFYSVIFFVDPHCVTKLSGCQLRVPICFEAFCIKAIVC